MFWTLQPFTYSLWRRAYSRNFTLQETLKLRCPIHHINSAARTKLSCATSAWYIISYRIISYKAQVKLLLAVAVGEPFLSKNVPTAKSRISQRLYFPTVKNKQLCGPQMLVACSYMLILPAISTSSRILIPSKNDSSSSSSSWIQITVMVFWKAFTLSCSWSRRFHRLSQWLSLHTSIHGYERNFRDTWQIDKGEGGRLSCWTFI